MKHAFKVAAFVTLLSAAALIFIFGSLFATIVVFEVLGLVGGIWVPITAVTWVLEMVFAIVFISEIAD